MDKYIKYEDIQECRFFQDERGEWILHADIIKIPAADVVPVVRCRECEFWERDRISCEGLARCRTGESGVRFRAKNDYCSRGIPKHKDSDGE